MFGGPFRGRGGGRGMPMLHPMRGMPPIPPRFPPARRPFFEEPYMDPFHRMARYVLLQFQWLQ